MKYYAIYDNGKLSCIGMGNGVPPENEITEIEYNQLLVEIRAKANWVSKVYSDPSLISQVPAEWQEEIQQRVDNRKQIEQDLQQEQISDAELADMVREVL